MPINFPVPLTLLTRLQFAFLLPLLHDSPCVTEQYDRDETCLCFQTNTMKTAPKKQSCSLITRSLFSDNMFCFLFPKPSPTSKFIQGYLGAVISAVSIAVGNALYLYISLLTAPSQWF